MKKLMHCSFLLLLFSCLSTSMLAQEADSLHVEIIQKLTDQLERFSEDADEIPDYTDLLEDYYYFAENPININSKEMVQLRDANLINPFQYENLLTYRAQFGLIHSLYELTAIDGFDDQTLALIKPLVVVDGAPVNERLSAKKVVKWGKHQWLIREEQVLEKAAGYQLISDSLLLAKPNTKYLGSRQKIYSKYAFSYRDRIKAGITIEKDAGEILLKTGVNDSIQDLLGNKLHNGFDFYSAHPLFSNFGIIKTFVVGDYHLSFGQGLSLWSGLSFGKSGSSTSIMKFGQGIKASSSANENTYLRGSAICFHYKQVELTLFYSNKLFDGNIGELDSTDMEYQYVTSIQETGLHRTVNELLDKGVIRQEMTGFNLNFGFHRLKLGYTFHHDSFKSALVQSLQPYNQFNFIPRSNTLQGIDFKYFLPKTVLFGEISHSHNGGIAGIGGISFQPVSFVTLTMSYRNFERNFQNFYANAFGENNDASNEQGFYLGLSAGLSPRLFLTAYGDFFSFPWLKYQVDAPSAGRDYFAQFDYRINKKATAYVRFRTKTKMTNDDNPWNYLDPLVDYIKTSTRFHIDYRISESVQFKDRAEYIWYKTQNDNSQGFIIFHDFIYRPTGNPIEFTFRYALFDSETYDSRLYAYENDVLYAFSIPSFNGKGTRSYLMFKYEPLSNVEIWVKLAQTWYRNQESIGAGIDEIKGDTKSELRMQIRWKF